MSTATPGNPLRVGLRRDRAADPCAIVIVGATGDLAHRKLLPALYNLHVDRLLPASFAIVGVGLKEESREEFAAGLRDALGRHARRGVDDRLWDELVSRLHYVSTAGDDGYRRLAEALTRIDGEHDTGGNRLFYLSTPPSAYPSILRGLAAVGLNHPPGEDAWARVVLEKPIGHDLASAEALNSVVNEAFDERDVYRIDHYLGKETVQNLLVFRFANAIFEPLWNQKYVDHVQITVAESIGVEGRGKYYEEAGTTRDMLQNHMFQLLCLTAMEPPVSLEADAIRNEKVKVLHALKLLSPRHVIESTVRGQYAEGVSGGERVPGYLEEPEVSQRSTSETYVAAELQIDSWRWSGVPFYLRAGKRLPKRVTEIALTFKDVPHQLFSGDLSHNVLALRIQPDEGITLKFDSKVPGPKPQIQPVTMDFRYGSSFGQQPPEAYERLILDAMLGDGTLFIRRDEVAASWRYVDRMYEGWAEADRHRLPQYTAGTWGPAEADVLLARGGRTWRRL